MELKKSEKANLEHKRGMFFQVGLAVALGLCLYTFEWSTKPSTDNAFAGGANQVQVEDVIINTERKEEAPKPQPEPPKVAQILQIVDNNTQVNDMIDISAESDDNTKVAQVEFSDDEEKSAEDEIFVIVEKRADFPGGQAALRKYLAENIVYPEMALENNLQGTVYVKFVVGKDGNVSLAEIVKGVDPALDNEALRVVKKLPKFIPAEQRGKPVRMWYTLPVKFTLTN